TDGLDAVGSLAHHQFGVVAHRLDALDAVQRFDSHDGRLVQHDSAVLHIDQSVRRAEVDRHVLRSKLEQFGEERSHRKTVSYRAREEAPRWAAGGATAGHGRALAGVTDKR